jgi:hypothetical protein
MLVLFVLLAILVSVAHLEEEPTLQQLQDYFIERELAWAEHTMELYKRKNNQMPLWSSIWAAHVHSEDWVQDPRGILETQEDPPSHQAY